MRPILNFKVPTSVIVLDVWVGLNKYEQIMIFIEFLNIFKIISVINNHRIVYSYNYTDCWSRTNGLFRKLDSRCC